MDLEIENAIWIKYDIETFKEIFCVVFKFEDKYLSFEISSRKNDLVKMLAFLKRSKKNWYYVGFNNIRFDAQIIQFIWDNEKKLSKLTTQEILNEIYEFAQEIIAKSNSKQFLPYQEKDFKFQQVDLYLINHYNNMARATSLKWLEYSMNWEKVQDLPYKHDVQGLTEEVFDLIVDYCKNDVDATDRFFVKSRKIIELRFAQQKESPNLKLLNKSDSTVGEMLFLQLMSEKLNISSKVLRKKQTHRSKIELKDTILPYINFKTETFQKVLNYFKEVVVTLDNPSFKLSVPYEGIDYIYGVGGLHASVSNEIVEPLDNEVLVDLDVASYYPNLSIRNKFFPKHLSEEFCVLYEELYDLRKSIPKSNPQNTSLKLLLNSIYGKSGDIYSFVYDKFFQMCITVNGQLLLTMLAERMSLIEGVSVFYANTDGITLRVRNDKKQDVFNVWKWWENFTKLELEHAVYNKMIIRDVNNYIAVYENGNIKLKGAFEIDVDYHKNRSQRIVPLAVKRYFTEGVPVEETIQNHLTSNKKGYFWNESKKEFETENQGIYDFCIGKKIKHNQKYSLEKKIENRVLPEHESKEEKQAFIESNGWYEHGRNIWRTKFKDYSGLTETSGEGFTSAWRSCILDVFPEYEKVKEIDDKVIRFYVSKNGLHLNKNYSDGRTEVTVGGRLVTMFMDFEQKENYQIDYQYYIDEAYKIVHEVDGTNEKLEKERKEKLIKEKKEKEELRVQQERDRQEQMFVKYCVEKNPTQKQYERYGLDWLIEKYGEPNEIR